jgi:serine/threonine protein phosphatase 1
MKTYAIGDVHGRADLLQALLRHIEMENLASSEDYRIVFLGDIIDRGPESKQAMDLVVAELDRQRESTLILGNHEEFLLLFLDLPDKRGVVFDHWMRNGGVATAASYGLDIVRPYDSIEEAHELLLDLLGKNQEHLEAMRGAASFVSNRRHLFVHAGLRPGVALEDQATKDLRTIRSDFLLSGYDFGQTVVHGHTEVASARPEVHNNRIALDTGAHATGVLTALALEEDGAPTFLSTRITRTGVTVAGVDAAVSPMPSHNQAQVAAGAATAARSTRVSGALRGSAN